MTKLRHFSTDRPLAGPPVLDWPSVERLFGDRLGGRRPVNGGTLGIGFLAELDGNDVFLKTHLTSDGRQTLCREAAFLQAAYGGSFAVDYREAVDEHFGKRGWLVMPALQPLAITPAPDTIHSMVEMFGRVQWSVTAAPNDDLALLLREAWAGLQRLNDMTLVQKDVAAAVFKRLTLLEDRLSDFPRIVCHGDLGPKNILSWNGAPIAIDWEDALWGIEGYDFLYWLTFMDNQRHCSRSTLGRSPWGIDVELSILVLIVLLKCYLSILTGDHHFHRTSINQRLTDIISL
nr:aminoglycoside phosphotransferase family protein [Nitrospirillum iridis]